MAETETQYTIEALLACLTLLYDPAAHIISIDDTVTQGRGDLERRISLRIAIPDRRLADFDVEVAEDRQRILIPLLTPTKGSLASVDEIRDETGTQLHRLSHSEHDRASCLMVKERLWLTYLDWIGLDPNYATIQMVEIERELCQLIGLEPAAARAQLNKVFDQDGRLKRYLNPIRPHDENRFYRLCKLLVERYIVLIELEGKVGERKTINYRHRQALGEDRRRKFDLVKEYLGSQPASLRFPVPRARYTNDYHFRMEAPPGHYFNYQLAVPVDGGPPMRKKREAVLPEFKTGRMTPCSAVESGALTEAHLYIAHGSKSTSRLDVALVVYEIPLGSASAAWAAAAISLAICSLLLLYRALTTRTGMPSDVPALLVALITSAAGFGVPLFQQGSAAAMSLLSRLSVLACGLLGNAFAVWWLLAATPIAKPETWPGHLARFLANYGGLLIGGLLAAVLALTTWRIVRLMKAYRSRLPVATRLLATKPWTG